MALFANAQQEAISNFTETPITVDGNIENGGEWGNWDALLEKRDNTPAYTFDGSISKEVLLKYLSRSATYNGLAFSESLYDDLRLIKNIRPKFLGRISYVWNRWTNFPGRPNPVVLTAEELFRTTKKTNYDIHSIDPDIITQSCIFEIVDKGFLENILIPEYVFTDFGLTIENRTFNYDAMLYDGTHYHNHWFQDMSVPDLTKQETVLWFYYLATQYINAGIESIHMGQIDLMNDNDDQYNTASFDLFAKIREYASVNARRHMVLIDAHVTTGGILDANNNLLFDFHSFPQRIKNDCNKQYQDASCPTGTQYWAYLTPNFVDAIYNRSKGGTTPSGWTCTELPYIVEFDNYGNQTTGVCNGSYWPWGWDEASWFANCTPEYRAYYLQYAYDRVNELDPGVGNLQMPLKVPLNTEEAADYRAWYRANTQSAACELGLSVEEAIKDVWGPLSDDVDLPSNVNAEADTYQQENITGTSNNTVLWKSRWDDDYLYLGILVSDTLLIGAANHIDANGAAKFKSDRIDFAIGIKPENYNLDMAIGDETPAWWDPTDMYPDGWGIPEDDVFGGIFLLNSRVELVNANDDFKNDKLDYVIKYHPNIRVENSNIVSGYIYEARIPWSTLTTNGETTYQPEIDNKLIFELINGDAENTVNNLTDLKSWGQSIESFISLNNAGFLVFKNNDITSVKTNNKTSINVTLKPNPVNAALTISSEAEISSIKILNISGQTVINQKIENKKELTINTNKLTPGVYFVKTNTRNGISINKIIKK